MTTISLSVAMARVGLRESVLVDSEFVDPVLGKLLYLDAFSKLPCQNSFHGNRSKYFERGFQAKYRARH